MKENQVNVDLESIDYLLVTMFENNFVSKREFIENCRKVIRVYDYLKSRNLEQDFFEYIEGLLQIEYAQDRSRLEYAQDKVFCLRERIETSSN